MFLTDSFFKVLRSALLLVYCKSSAKTPIVFTLCLFTALCSFAQPVGYRFSKPITINATQVIGGASYTDFPVMIRFTGADTDLDLRSTINGGKVENTNGFDIVFTSDAAGTTLLDHQIESYDPVTGEYVAWVKIPTLSNSVDTEFYMFYGNCDVTDPSTTDTWNSDFDAVYFLHDDFNDATANNYNGTNNGSVDASPAAIGDGQTFDDDQNLVSIPTSSISTAQGTVSIWAYADSWVTPEHYMLGHTSNPTGFANRLQLYTDDGVGGLDVGFGANHNLEQGIINLAAATWNYIALSWNGTSISVYVNGVLEHTENYANFGTLAANMHIGNDGRNIGTADEGWGGDLDHARLSNSIFSANWIQTEYNNQVPNSTFLSAGTEVSYSTTYYSFASGDWDDNNSWSLSSDGSSGALSAGVWPNRNDNVVINTGHTITINSVDDNYACGISADDLGRSNVGNGGDPFTGSDDPMFYHVGDILISSGGTISVSEEFMIEGYTLVEDGGTLDAGEDVINLGYLEFSTTSTFDTSDDLILTGNSVTIIDNTATAADDLYIEWTDATLCGDGVYNLGNGSPDPAIQYWNGATSLQVCSDFEVTCTTNCTGFPVSGTGTFISGNTGLGGIGSFTSLRLWLKADDLSFTDGSSVTSWSDVSGNGLTASADGGGGTEPTFNTNDVNTVLPSVSFDGGDYLNLGQPTELDFTPGTDSWTFFVVYNVGTGTPTGTFLSKADGVGGDRTYQYTADVNGGNSVFTSFIGGGFTQGTEVVSTGNWTVSGHTNNATVRNSWTNETADVVNNAIGTNTTGAVDVLVGARRATAPSTGFGFALTGSISEIAMYEGEMNEVQRVIITNYLSAKYNIGLTANDVYTEDDNGYDFDMVGIGQAADGTKHIDSRGSGITRIWKPTDLANGEYLTIAHDGTSVTSVTTDPSDVDGTVIEQRLNRIWAVSEVGDVGTVSISIDFSAFGGSALGSNLRLLIDRDGDFATNDVTPIVGSVANDIAVFSNVDFQDGDLFTLGNTDASQPLPIELNYFSAQPENGTVLLSWETASETDNDFFTIERKGGDNIWEEILQMEGAGNSKTKISYSSADNSPLTGGSYYRLKQTDFDGKFTYSDAVFIWLDKGTVPISVYPNPSKGTFYIDKGTGIVPEQLILHDVSGKQVHFNLQEISNGYRLDITNLSPGIYLLKVMNGKEVLSTSRLIKN